MPYSNPEDRRAQQRRYRASEQGKQAHRRANAAHYARTRADRPVQWKPNPAPLAQVVNTWSTQ